MPSCNHVRDTLGHYFRIPEQGINQELLSRKKRNMRYLFSLKLEYMGKDRNIPSLILWVVKSKYRSLSLESISFPSWCNRKFFAFRFLEWTEQQWSPNSSPFTKLATTKILIITSNFFAQYSAFQMFAIPVCYMIMFWFLREKMQTCKPT